MKLRCISNSIRIRLRKSDVKVWQDESKLLDSLQFPNGSKLEYGLMLSEFENNVIYDAHTLIIYVNKREAKGWAESNEVSLTFNLDLPNQSTLRVLIEKDFPCKHTGDDFEDTYHELQPEEHKMFRKESFSRN